MNLGEFENAVRALNVRQLEAALRFLHGGPLGYDYRKTGPNKTFSKLDLQNRLITHYAPIYAKRDADNPKSIAVVWADIADALTNDQRVQDQKAAGVRSDAVAAWAKILPQEEVSQVSSDLGRDPGLGGQSEGGGGSGGGATQEGEGTATEGGQEGSGEGSSQGEGEGESEGQGSSQDDGSDSASCPDAESDAAKPGEAEDNKESAGGKLQKAVQEALDRLGIGKPQAPAVDMERVADLIQKEMEKRANVYRIEVQTPDQEQAETLADEEPRHEIFKEFLSAVNAGENVLLVGPAGCGKTHLARAAAEIMGKQFGFTGAVSTEHKLLGYTDAHGRLVRTIYRESYEHGWWFLWDELDASGAQPMLSFNAGLANGHQDFPDGIITRHKDFRAIASANTYGHGADRQYVGRNQLDAASLDRFYVIPMDYDEALEKALYGNTEWVKFVQNARRAVRKLGLRHVVSMRAIESGLRMLKTGKVSRVDVERGALWKNLNKDDVGRIKQEMFGGQEKQVKFTLEDEA